MRRKRSHFIRHQLLPMLVVFTVTTSVAWGWGGAFHSSITRAALDVLPQWEKDIWKDHIPSMIKEYCLIPDFYLTRPDLAGYAILDDYQVTLGDYTYRVTKDYIIRNGHFHLPDKQRENFRLYEYFFGKVVASLKENKIEDSAKFAGVLLHIMEDYSAPAHSVQGDNQFLLFKQFLPPPEKFTYTRLHGPIEYGSAPSAIPDHRLRLLGTSPSEVAFHMNDMMNSNIIEARGKVIPIIQAIYREDEKAALAENSIMARRSAGVSADVLHSAFCIAFGRFEIDTKNSLKTADISETVPQEAVYLAWRQHNLFSPIFGGAPTSGIILDKQGQPVPLILKVSAAGKLADRTIGRGIAVGTRQSLTGEPCVLSYIVPEDVYDRFEAVAGIHSQLGVDGAVILQVKGDGKLLYDSGPLERNDPARTVSVPLAGVKEIQLISFPARKASPDNFVVWGEPRYVKKDE
jgi:hypothetical protein